MEVEAFIIGLPGASGLAELSNQQVIDCVQKATPNSLFGLTIYSLDGTTPDLGDNPWVYRCLLIDRANNQAKIYNLTSGLWEPLSLGSVTSASQIADGIISLSKLSTSGGGALKILRLNASNVLEYAALSSILIADSVPLSAINRSGATAGDFIRHVGGQVVWDSIANVAATIISAISSYDIQKLSSRIASSILTNNASGVAEWLTFTTFLSTTIPANSISPSKIDSSSATELDVLGKKDGVTKLFTPPFTKSQVIVDGATLPAQGANALRTYAHTLGVVPKLIDARLRCVSSEHGYAVNEEVSLDSLGWNSGVPSYVPFGHFSATTTDISMIVRSAGGGFYTFFYSKASPPVAVTLTVANWRLVFYLYA